jgi:hypothetical protein
MWPLNDKADPLDGWPIAHVSKTVAKATQDLYGNLYIYLLEEFCRFLARIATVNVTVYEVRTSRALSQRSSLHSMSAFHTGIH